MRLVEKAANVGDSLDWEKQLQRNTTGGILASPPNAYQILLNHPDWAGVIAFNEFTRHVVKLAPPPFHDGMEGLWSDVDDSKAMLWLAQNFGINMKTAQVAEAVQLVAADHKFHPVFDWLTDIKWDGSPRIDTWLQRYLGVKPTPYMAAVGPKILVAAVVRIFLPGSKVDTMPIFEGPQGIGKSTAIKILAGSYYGETAITIGDKDSFLMMSSGYWIIELAELESLNKTEATRAKQFLSATKDSFRKPYGRRIEEYRRQCVFWGTTNSADYLRDDTGGRRFWPIKCGTIDLEALERDRDQLWAEARVRFGEDTPWHVLPEEAHLFNAEQDERYMADAWEEKIASYLASRPVVRATALELLTEAIGLATKEIDRSKQMRVASCMRRLAGWRKVRVRQEGRQSWMWEREPE